MVELGDNIGRKDINEGMAMEVDLLESEGAPLLLN
jgi:hypothetical protein